MKVTIVYREKTAISFDEEVTRELDNDDLQTFLACDCIGYDGRNYRIVNKLFVFDDMRKSLKVLAELDDSIAL